ncbi:hypothetical protein GQ42DRAFT_165035 [Ramicandelaber brevisporus]|nr:hypothetical protein GQ42DRAFT_165035 [Ramicandelaber brevisporus]
MVPQAATFVSDSVIPGGSVIPSNSKQFQATPVNTSLQASYIIHTEVRHMSSSTLKQLHHHQQQHHQLLLHLHPLLSSSASASAQPQAPSLPNLQQPPMRVFATVASVCALASCALGYEMRAYTGTDYGGRVTTKSDPGKSTGVYASYKWSGTRSGYCVRICRGATSLGWRCDSYSNNNVKFDKFIICGWESTACECN